MHDLPCTNPCSDQPPDTTVQVLVCFAVREEARFFIAPIRPVTHTLITGMGVRNTSLAVGEWLSRHQPAFVLSCGFAGGLNPAHRLGQVLFDDRRAGPFQNKLTGESLQAGQFVHSDHVLVTASEKLERFKATGGDAVEMESSAVVAVCDARGLPVLVIRAISDTAMEDLPLDFNRFSRSDGNLSLPRLLVGIARSPSTVPELIRFRRRLTRAARNLATVLDRFLTLPDLF